MYMYMSMYMYMCWYMYMYTLIFFFLNSLSVRVLYNSSNNLVSASRGAESTVRPLFGNFYYKTQVQLTLFMFLTRSPQ